jgi:hypothetical protein
MVRGKTANVKGRAEMLWELIREPEHGDGDQTHYGIDEGRKVFGVNWLPTSDRMLSLMHSSYSNGQLILINPAPYQISTLLLTTSTLNYSIITGPIRIKIRSFNIAICSFTCPNNIRFYLSNYLNI